MENKEFEINYEAGRLLAICDLIEIQAKREKGDNSKQTNAKEYFAKYFDNPAKTYTILRKKLIPYESKIRNLNLIKLRQEIVSNINPEEFNKLRKLDGRALCGYDAQIAEYYKNMKENKEESEVLDNE